VLRTAIILPVTVHWTLVTEIEIYRLSDKSQFTILLQAKIVVEIFNIIGYIIKK